MGVLTAHPEADKVTSTSRELKPKREREKKILTTTLIFLVLSDGKLLALDIFSLEEVTSCLGFSCRLRNQKERRAVQVSVGLSGLSVALDSKQFKTLNHFLFPKMSVGTNSTYRVKSTLVSIGITQSIVIEQ